MHFRLRVWICIEEEFGRGGCCLLNLEVSLASRN